MDKLFKSSKIIITEALSNYLEKEDNIMLVKGTLDKTRKNLLKN
jgi:hypothetical protein